MKDWRGTEIEVGSRVLYPTRQNSTQHIHEGIVTSVREPKSKGPLFDNGSLRVEHVRSTERRDLYPRKQNRVTITAVNRVTVIATAKEELLRTQLTTA